MNLLEKLCKELGVEVGEEWLGSDGLYYYISYSGKLISTEYKADLIKEHRYGRPDNISRVLTGKLKPVWKPKSHEKYYVPSVSMSDKYIDLIWTNCPGDEKNYKRGIAFRTKEEAIEMANKMLKLAKEER